MGGVQYFFATHGAASPEFLLDGVGHIDRSVTVRSPFCVGEPHSDEPINAAWGLRRWRKAPVRKSVGSNLTPKSSALSSLLRMSLLRGGPERERHLRRRGAGASQLGAVGHENGQQTIHAGPPVNVPATKRSPSCQTTSQADTVERTSVRRMNHRSRARPSCPCRPLD